MSLPTDTLAAFARAAPRFLFGISFGKASIEAGKADAAIRAAARVVLVEAGLYVSAAF